MRNRKLSTLGFLMDRLNIPTVSLSRELHVDASLVSKWKSGDRCLNGKSAYFDEVIAFLMRESEKSGHRILKSALTEVYPMDNLEDCKLLEPFVRRLLSDSKVSLPRSDSHSLPESHRTVPVGIYEQNAGRRKAVLLLLAYANQLPHPGQLIFIDSEEYAWLIEEPQFAEHFVQQINALLEKGFTARFAIHFSSYRERFVRFFEICNLLLFHRNVEWFYYEDYDDKALNFSLFILNKAFSLLGLTSGGENSAVMAFTDTASILYHEALACDVIDRCQRLFLNFDAEKCKDVVDYIRVIRKRGSLYAYLPAPAFVSAETGLLKEILKNNHLEAAQIEDCLCVNHLMREIVHTQFRGIEDIPERIVQILQLEEMERRARSQPFISCSLTLLGGKEVQVTKPQYAKCLRNLAASLEKYDHLEIAFLSQSDNVPLPGIPEMNCWCKQNTWMVQMDQEGFRISDEVSIVNAASITLERCLRKIPPERKEKSSVIPFLLRFAEDLEKTV